MKKLRLFTLSLLASVIATSAVADSDVVLTARRRGYQLTQRGSSTER